jgi:hypothetical protein
MSGPEGGHAQAEGEGEEPGLGGLGKFLHYMGAGTHVLEGIGEAGSWIHTASEAMEGGGGIMKAIGAIGSETAEATAAAGTGGLLPYVGAVTGTLQAGIEGYNAYEEFSKEGYHSDNAWNSVGGSALGATGAAVTFIPGYGPLIGAALGAGELAADALGAGASAAFGKEAGFSASSMAGNFIRGTFGDKSMGEDLSNMVGGGVGGHILGTAANVLALPGQAITTIGGQVAGEIGAIGHGLMDENTGVGQYTAPVLGAIGSGISTVGSGLASAGSAVLSFLSDVRMKRDVAPIRGALSRL